MYELSCSFVDHEQQGQDVEHERTRLHLFYSRKDIRSWAALIRRRSQSFATLQNSARTMLPFTGYEPTRH